VINDVAVYVRVSKREQHPENQIDALNEFCSKMQYKPLEYYVDRRSGRETRPELERLKNDVATGRYQVIVIWKLDRIFRNLKELLILLDLLEEWDVKLVSATENLDTGTAAGKLAFHILGAMAEYESNAISERTKLGLSRVKKEGTLLGGDIGVERRQRIVDSYLETKSMRETGRVLGEAYSTVRDTIKKSGIRL